jgi:hypothetical protein
MGTEIGRQQKKTKGIEYPKNSVSLWEWGIGELTIFLGVRT